MKTRSAGVPAKLAPAVDILEGLINRVIDQFLFMVEYYTDLVLTGQSPFNFVQPLFDNHVENIRKVGGAKRVEEYQARVKQLGQYLASLQDFEGANVVEATQLVLANMREEQSRLQEEVKKQIEEWTRHLNEMWVSYQSSLKDLQRAELNAKSVEGLIAMARGWREREQNEYRVNTIGLMTQNWVNIFESIWVSSISQIHLRMWS